MLTEGKLNDEIRENKKESYKGDSKSGIKLKLSPSGSYFIVNILIRLQNKTLAGNLRQMCYGLHQKPLNHVKHILKNDWRKHARIGRLIRSQIR